MIIHLPHHDEVHYLLLIEKLISTHHFLLDLLFMYDQLKNLLNVHP